MNTNHASHKSLYQRSKLALIPLLGLVLAAVLFWPAKRQINALLPGSASSTNRLPAAVVTGSKTWPPATWTEVAAVNSFDPRARPTPSNNQPAEADPEHRETEQISTEASHVQAIYEDHRGAIAIVNDHIVRVGDLLGGRRVLAISAKGVVLESTTTSH